MLPLFSNEQPRTAINAPSVISKRQQLSEEELMTSINKGNSYLMNGQFESALMEFNRLAELSPNTGDIYISRGIVLEKLLLWNEAIDDYKRANQIYRRRPFSGDDPIVFSNIANAETGLLQWDNALRDFSYAIKLKPDFIAPQIGRALVQYQLGQYNTAGEYFESLVDQYPEFPDGLALYAIYCFHNGDMKEANYHWTIATKLDSRYLDVEWVRDIRRWPPALVTDLALYLKEVSK